MQFVEDTKKKKNQKKKYSHAALHTVIVVAKRATEDGRQLLLAPLRRRLRGRLPLPHRPPRGANTNTAAPRAPKLSG